MRIMMLTLPIAPEILFKADLAMADRVKNMGGWSGGF
jgi:hypothetical protein